MLEQALKNWYEQNAYPPSGKDLGDNVKQVSHEIVDRRRWGNEIEVVYTDDKEFWAVLDVEPATESQDWGDYGEPDIYEVTPYEVTVVKYKKK